MDDILTAVVQLAHSTRPEDLKRLVLVFDKVHYVLPSIRVVKPDVSEQLKRGAPLFLDAIRDTHRLLHLVDVHDSQELQETIDEFREAGCLVPVGPRGKVGPEYWSTILDCMIISDIQDARWNELSETRPEDYPVEPGEMAVQCEGGEIEQFFYIPEPNAVADSCDIATTLLIADDLGCCPIFLDPRHRRELAYRYEQHKVGRKIVAHYLRAEEDDFKARFGEVAFKVSSSVFSSDALASKSPRDVLKYREEMTESRCRYVRADLVELAGTIADSPWDQKAKSIVRKYIREKLQQDLLSHDEQCRATWEKLFGNLAVHAAAITKATVIGAGSGGLLGNVIPNSSPGALLLLGALAGATAEVPNLVKTIADLLLNLRERRRSSVAYVAEWLRSA